MARLEYQKIAPEGFLSFRNVLRYVGKSKLPETLVQLVYLRVSQINNCPYCIDLHWQEATKAGEDGRKLNALSTWQDTPFFSKKERAALAWAEAVTLLVDQNMMEELFVLAREHFSEKELVDLTFAAAQMNAFNRVAIAFHTKPTA
jgi:AhpD family alkylhydroperoxidase